MIARSNSVASHWVWRALSPFSDNVGPGCVASATSGQNASAEMRDFELLRASRRWSEVDEQTRTSTIYGGPETGDFTRGGPARRDGERGVPTSQPIALGAVSMAGGSPGRLGGGAEARCAAKAA